MAAPVTSAPVTAYIALGANLGDAAATVAWAMDAIDALPQTQLVQRSSFYRTAPVDATGPDFINAVVEISTGLGPEDLLRALQAVELSAGRERPYRNAPRTLDLDILLYGSLRQTSKTLTLPHPRMHERAFVLVPLAEIAPGLANATQLAAVAGQAIARLAH